MQKNLTITLDKAKELYKNGGNDIKQLLLQTFTKEELEKKELPKSWEELGVIEGYFIDACSIVHSIKSYTTNDSKNAFPTKEYTIAALALAQLLQLRKVYIGDWEPDWGNHTCKHVINVGRTISRATYSNTQFTLSFPTPELRDEFFNNFQELLEQAKPLL